MTDAPHHDHAGHSHAHHHHGDGKIGAAVMVNLGLTVAQLVGGVFAGSLALIADAIHNLSDALSLIIAFVARRIARRPADATMTFGYARAETVAALVNYTTLILIGVWLAAEAVMRFFAPEPINGWIVVILAAVALAVDIVTAALTYSMSKSSMNIRAAFLHNVADALASVGVIIAGSLIILYDLTFIDPLITLMISAYILWHAAREIGAVIHVLMLGTPPSLSTDAVLTAMRTQPGVEGVHHLHLWQMEETRPAVQAHVVIAEGRWSDADAIKDGLRAVLATLGIAHSTLELECHAHACQNPQDIGH